MPRKSRSASIQRRSSSHQRGGGLENNRNRSLQNPRASPQSYQRASTAPIRRNRAVAQFAVVAPEVEIRQRPLVPAPQRARNTALPVTKVSREGFLFTVIEVQQYDTDDTITLHNDKLGIVQISIGQNDTSVKWFGKETEANIHRRDIFYDSYAYYLSPIYGRRPRYGISPIGMNVLSYLTVKIGQSVDSKSYSAHVARLLREYNADLPTARFPYGTAINTAIVKLMYDEKAPRNISPSFLTLQVGDTINLKPEVRTARTARAKSSIGTGSRERRYIGKNQYCERDDETGWWIDPISSELIPPRYLVEIDDRCYDARALNEWIKQFRQQDVRPTDPFTRKLLTAAKISEIQLKVTTQ